MNEFNKWWGNSVVNFEEYRLAERVWKAALEWALLLNSVRIHDDVYKDIKEELKDED